MTRQAPPAAAISQRPPHASRGSHAETPPTRHFQDQVQITFTTHNYERGVDLVAIQQLLGHWTVSSTMRYVRPSATFIEDAYRRAVAATLGELSGEEPTA